MGAVEEMIVSLLRLGVSPEEAGRAARAAVGDEPRLEAAPEAAPRAPATGDARTVREMWPPYLEAFDVDSRPASQKTLRSHAKATLRFFGDMPWTDVNRTTIDRYKATRMTAPSPRGGQIKARTINKELQGMHSMLMWHVQSESIARNPMKDWKKMKELGRPPIHITTDQLLLYLGYAHPLLKQISVLAFSTGMRRGELVALRWDWIDIKTRRLTIPAEVAKSGKERTILLSEVALDILTLVPRHINAPYVFPNPKGHGGPLPAETLYGWFRSARERAGIGGAVGRQVVFHSFRSSWATLTSSRGAPTIALLKQGGWSNEQTANIYRDFSADEEKRMLEAMDANPRAAEIMAAVRAPRKSPQRAEPAVVVPDNDVKKGTT